MSVRTCNHVRKNGCMCKAIALNGRDFCYFHLTARARRLKAAHAQRRGEVVPLTLPFPEDVYSVQIGLHEVMLAIAEKRIDSKDAGLLLYSLQQAASNVISSGCMYGGMVEKNDEWRPIPVTAYPGLEDEYQLPAGTDLTHDPNDDLSGNHDLLLNVDGESSFQRKMAEAAAVLEKPEESAA